MNYEYVNDTTVRVQYQVLEYSVRQQGANWYACKYHYNKIVPRALQAGIVSSGCRIQDSGFIVQSSKMYKLLHTKYVI